MKQIDLYSVFIVCLVSKFRTHFYFGCSIICQRLDKIHLTIHSTFSNTHGPHVLAQSASQSSRTKSRHVSVDQNVPMDGVGGVFSQITFQIKNVNHKSRGATININHVEMYLGTH